MNILKIVFAIIVGFVGFNQIRGAETIEIANFPGKYHRDSLKLSVTASYSIEMTRDLFLELKQGNNYITGTRMTIDPSSGDPASGDTVISVTLSEKLMTNTEYTFNLSIREKGGNWQTQIAVASKIFTVVDNGTEALSEVYVSEDGNDTNEGTITSPLRTIQKASELLEANGTCYIRGGTYRETVNVSKSGQTFTAYNDEYVLVTGLDTLSGWTVYKDNIYQADFADFETQFTQLFIDGNFMQMARYPNNETGEMMDPRNPKTGYGTCFVNSTGETVPTRKVVFDQMPSHPDNFWKGGYFRGISGYTWMNPHGVIASSTGGELQVTPVFSNWESGQSQVHGYGYGFIFHLNALDTYGEWYAQNGKIYLMPPQNSQPSDFTVEAQKREWAFVINGLSGIKLKKINIKAASLKFNNANQCVVDSCSVRYLFPFFTRKSYGTSFTQQGGIYVNGDNNTFMNSYIAHSWGNGFSIEDGNGNTVDNCVIEDIGWDPQFCSSVLTHGKNTTIENSTLGSAGRFHIRFKNKTDILHCDLYDCMKMGQDAGSIESTVGGGSKVEDLQGSEIAYNKIHDCNTLPKMGNTKQFVVAFYLEDVANYTVHHNLVWNIKTDVFPDGAFCYLGPRHETIYNVNYINNTIWNCDEYIDVWNRDNLGGINTTTFANNLYDSRMKSSFGTPSLESGFTFVTNINHNQPDAYFTDYSNGDFTLKTGSPAIDAGTRFPGITDGFTGTAPDVGAFEDGIKAWTAGATLKQPVFEEVTDISTAVDQPKILQQKAKLYPNPTRHSLTIQGISEKKVSNIIEIYSVTGNKVFSKKNNLSDVTLDVSFLPKGMYFVCLGRYPNQNLKFIKE